MQRRDFLKKSAGALALATLAPAALAAEESNSDTIEKRPIHKAIMWGTVGVKGSVSEKMKLVKEAGFEGVEMNSHMDQDEVVRARDENGLIIPSVCGAHHWEKPLSHPDPKVREEGLEALRQTLRHWGRRWPSIAGLASLHSSGGGVNKSRRTLRSAEGGVAAWFA